MFHGYLKWPRGDAFPIFLQSKHHFNLFSYFIIIIIIIIITIVIITMTTTIIMYCRDICACAATGTGKTGSFVIPIVERLLHRYGITA